MGHVQMLAVTLTRRAAGTLAAAAQATPDDKMTWQPLAHGRSVLEQLVDCALDNLQWARILERRAYLRLADESRQGALTELSTREKALARLDEATTVLVQAIESVQDDEIGRVLAVPSEEGVDLTLAECCLQPYWNMVYHTGQISYIQSLYSQASEDSPGISSLA